MLRLHATVAHRYVTSVNPAANERGTPVLLRDATRVEGDLRAQACYDAKRQRDPAREPAGEPVPMTQTCTVVIKLSGLWWTGWFEEVPDVNCQERSRLPKFG